MFRLYKKTKRLVLVLCLTACIMTRIVLHFRDGDKINPESDYVNSFKRLFYIDKRNMAGDRRSTALQSQGYSLAERLRKRCLAVDNSTYSMEYIRLNMMYQTTSGDLQLCPIWKAGSTFLKRLFLMSNNKGDYFNPSTPFDISFLAKYEPISVFMSNLPDTQRFVFTRDPYKRVLSSYIDKLFAPNPVYWRIVGTRAIQLVRPNPDSLSLKCGHDLMFAEYVKYIIVAMTPGNTFRATPDMHFQQGTKLCKPCYAKYDFVGKLETFQTDVFELMDRMNMTKTKDLLTNNLDELTADDAIRDTLSQPFDEIFRDRLRGCISFNEALRRAWMKLQMRGLIGRKALDLASNNMNAENITQDQLIELAREARRVSTVRERRALKREYLKSFYKSISLNNLKRIREIYADDFELFEYNERPDYIYSGR